MALRDALGQEIKIGSKVTIARTAKSKGISWRIADVSRVTEKRFFYMRRSLGSGELYEEMGVPHNAVVIDKLVTKSG